MLKPAKRIVQPPFFFQMSAAHPVPLCELRHCDEKEAKALLRKEAGRLQTHDGHEAD